MDFDEGALRKLIREETRNALKDIGLADDDADTDIRDLRSLISEWRGIKKTIWNTVARWGTMVVLGIMTLGVWAQFGGKE